MQGLVGNTKETHHLEDVGRYYNRSSRNRTKGHRLDLSSSGKRQVAGSCKSGSKPLGSIKWGEFPDQLKHN